MDIRAMLDGTDASPQIVAILSMMSDDIKNLKAENKHLKDLLEIQKSQPEKSPVVATKADRPEDAWNWNEPATAEEIRDAEIVLGDDEDCGWEEDDLRTAKRVLERAEIFGTI
jgi:hypothetical protein